MYLVSAVLFTLTLIICSYATEPQNLDDPSQSVDITPIGFHSDGIGGFINHEFTFDGSYRPPKLAPYRSRQGFVIPSPDPANEQNAGRSMNHEAIKYTLDGKGGLGGQGAVVQSGK